MFWYDHDVSGWGWFAMSLSMALFWAMIITFGVLLFRALTRADTTRAPHSGAPATEATPERVLADRFARGEIDEDEYERRLRVLRAAGSGPRRTES